MKLYNPIKGHIDLQNVLKSGYFTKFETYVFEIKSLSLAGEDFFNNL